MNLPFTLTETASALSFVNLTCITISSIMSKSGYSSRRSGPGEDAEGEQNLLYVVLEKGSRVFLTRKGSRKGIFISAGPDINLNATRGRALERLEMSVLSFIYPRPWRVVPHLIPAYKESIAKAQADRQKTKSHGKGELRIAVIDADKLDGKVKHRDLRSLARQFGIRIPRQDWDRSEYEYVISHYIPLCAVLDDYRV